LQVPECLQAVAWTKHRWVAKAALETGAPVGQRPFDHCSQHPWGAIDLSRLKYYSQFIDWFDESTKTFDYSKEPLRLY